LCNVIAIAQAQNNGLSAVLDFLTTNPETSKHMTNGQIVGARIISNFLNSNAQMQHDLEVAQAGQPQVNVNAKSNVQEIPNSPEAHLKREADGRVYLYYGNHEPILIPEKYLLSAMGIDYDTDYNSDEILSLKRMLSHDDFVYPTRLEKRNLPAVNDARRWRDRKGIYYDFTDPKWGEKLALVQGEQTGLIYYKAYSDKYPGKHVQLAVNDHIINFTYYEILQQLDFSFTCNWFENTSFMEGIPKLENFHGIKRNFKQGEKLEIIVAAALERRTVIKMSYFNEETGDSVGSIRNSFENMYYFHAPINTTAFPVGKYLYFVQIENPDKTTGKSLLRGYFNILPSTNSSPTTTVSSNEQFVNIQDIPRGIFFYSGSKMEGEVPIYSGVNKSEYDISHGIVRVELNALIKGSNLDVVWQSFTLSGELLGTTTRDHFGAVIGDDLDPYKDKDFLDKVALHGPGKYIIKAMVEATGEEFERILTIK